LKDHIEELLYSVQHAAKFEIRFTSTVDEGMDLTLAHDKKVAFLCIMMTQLNNIVRHSRAKRVRVSLMQRSTDIILYIQDDGIGFDHRRVRHGRGFSNIHARVGYFGGLIDISAVPGAGCSMTVLLPYHS